MGWGQLFFGYFLVYFLGMNPMSAVFSVIPGALFLWLGLRGLSRYCHTFRYALWCTPLLAATSLAGIVGGLVSADPALMATAGDWLTAVTSFSGGGVVAGLNFALTLIYHGALTLGIKELAARVGVQKNAIRAARNLVIVGLWGFCSVLLNTLPQDTGKLFRGSVGLLMLIWSICYCVLIYSCYMRIAPAEETAPARKPSRFGWVNRLRDAYEEKTQKAIDADRAYHAKNARERWEKKQSRMSRKQREKQERRQHRDRH
jgi:hypothetical protein